MLFGETKYRIDNGYETSVLATYVQVLVKPRCKRSLTRNSSGTIGVDCPSSNVFFFSQNHVQRERTERERRMLRRPANQ